MYSFFNKAYKQIIPNKNNQRLIENVTVGAATLGSMSWGFSNRNKWVEREVTLFKSCLSQDERNAIERSPDISEKYLQQCKEEIHLNMMSSVL